METITGGKKEVREYWNSHLHDMEIAKAPVGTKKFFENITKYHFNKLDYLKEAIGFDGYKGKKVLDAGCGMAIDLLEFAKGGANVTGIDLAEKPMELAKKNFRLNSQSGSFRVMDAEKTSFKQESFDVVYQHGLLQYTPNPEKCIKEAHRILKKEGELLIGVYNTYSWLTLVTKITGVSLEHVGAPVFRTFSYGEMKKMLKNSGFEKVEMRGERFPVPTKLHSGLKATLYNTIFVKGFNLIPRCLVRRYGWHIIVKARK